jgi:hypothetical protein
MAVFPVWLDLLCAVTLLIGAACAVVILIDVLRHPQHMGIMNVVWPVCALFGTLFILWLYYQYGRDSRPQPYAISVAKGSLHCGSGCALGDIVAEWLAYAVPGIAIAFGWQILFDEKTFAVWILDLLVAFAIGIVFQYFAIAPMRNLTPAQGMVAALKADALSLLSWQLGMYGLMAIFQFLVFPRHFGGPAPVDSVEFWGAMQLAMIAGFMTSFPMNWWLIRAGIKEAM